jgi:cellulose synthase operon protein C
LRAQTLGRLGEIAEAEAAAAESRERSRAAGLPEELAHACLLHGVTLRQLDRGEEALAAFDEALAQPGGPAVRRLVVRQRAGLLANSARAAEAIGPLAEEIATLTAAGDRETIPHTQYELAIAYLNAGRPLDAAEVGEEALAAFDAAADPQALAVRDLLVAVYHELSEHDAVLAQLTAMATTIAAADDPEALAQITERLAEALDRADRDATAAARFADAAAAWAAAERPVDALRARRRHATSLLWAGQPEPAVAALADADAAAVPLPGEPHALWERAMLDYDGARLLDRVDRTDEAIPRAARAAEGFRALGAGTQAGFAGLLHGELLRGAGRAGEAGPVLSAALAQVPDDEPALRGQLERALSALPEDRF